MNEHDSAPQCTYCSNTVYEDGMCEYCYYEDQYMRTCDTCGTDEYTDLRMGNINAYYECAKCLGKWM